MHTINFLNATSPEHQQSLARWYRISFAAVVFSFLIVGTISVQQLYTLKAAHTDTYLKHKKISPLLPHLERKGQLQEELISLTPKIDQIKQSTLQTEAIRSFFATLEKVCSKQAKLILTRWSNGLQELILSTPTIHDANTILKQLRDECSMKNLCITALEPISSQQHKNGLLISIQQSTKNKSKA